MVGAALACAPAHAGGNLPTAGVATGLGLTGGERERALQCLAQAISYEAGHEPQAGQEAVAQVVLNRLRDPAYPKTVCGVVYQGSERRTGCQFTFTCDGAMARWKPGASWAGAVRIATLAIDGGLPASAVGTALNYHAGYVHPGWAARLTRVTQIGQHIFYGAGGGAAVAAADGPRDAPRTATLSVWGLTAAVLTPVAGGGVAVRTN
ncbi:cell wall hydrolase [Sphingomonas sp.]|uniref:cell wall hydrolase n=1 Tax=Sphingomonas sp. TaxID=28214 RepID=UPI003B002407